MSGASSHLVQGILAHLTEHGQATQAELQRALGLSRNLTAAILFRLRKPCLTLPQRIHIADWAHEDECGRRYPRPVFALGRGKDKPKPKRDTRANSRRYRERNKGQVTSVFDLARKERSRRALVKGLPTCSRL